MSFIPQDLYDLIFNRVPRACVDMIIRDTHGRFFLTCRDIEPYKGLWHFPGGGIKFKETIAQAASRIAKKEFGVDVRVIKHLPACETMNDDLSADKPRHSISSVVVVEVVSGVPLTTSESSAIEYFSVIPEKMHPYHGAYLKDNNLL